MKKRRYAQKPSCLIKISRGLLLSVCLLALGRFCVQSKGGVWGGALLSETMPQYKMGGPAILFKMDDGQPQTVPAAQGDPAADDGTVDTVPAFAVQSVENRDVQSETPEVVGLNDIIFQPETDNTYTANSIPFDNITKADLDKLKNLDYMRNSLYVVDKKTAMTAQDFNVDKFMAIDTTINNKDAGPKILIFHTHSQEAYIDSASGDIKQGVVGAGERLAQILTEKYGIETIHDTGRYDMVDGKSQIMGAYERMEPSIQKILDENPSIQMVIDMHRDGVADNTHLVTTVNGKPTAQFMFFNGLSELNNGNGLQPIQSLPNPYLPTNLALSFKLQMEANALYPGLTRKIYLNAYRYSLNMKPLSTLVEVGAQTNTKEEAFNAMEPLADIIAGVVLAK